MYWYRLQLKRDFTKKKWHLEYKLNHLKETYLLDKDESFFRSHVTRVIKDYLICYNAQRFLTVFTRASSLPLSVARWIQSIFPRYCNVLTHHIFTDLIILVIFVEKHKLRSRSLSHLFVLQLFRPFAVKIFSSAPSPRTPPASLHSFIYETKFRTNKSRGRK
jgi:hypothetical protein